jgi:hypothetical protein
LNAAAYFDNGRAARLRGWLRGAAVACVLLTALPSAAEDAAFSTAKRLWRTAALTSYEYGYRKYCECHPDTPPETIVTVRDGSVVGVRHRPIGYDKEVPAEQRNLQYYWTVDGLFDLLAAAFERSAEVRVKYDPARGFPTEIFVDYDTNAIGDELDVKVTQVSALAGG